MQFSQAMTPLQIPGPSGELEIVVERPRSEAVQLVAIICHPHPLYGGSMTNKVVTTLARALQDLGLWTVRFNFRGIGKSQGTYDKAVGEGDDLLAVVNFVKANFPSDFGLWLGGFSFGAYVAMQAVTQVPAKHLILIAPPVHDFNFSQLPEITIPWLVVQGESDEVVPPEQVFAWIKHLKHPPRLIRFPQVGHFFHGKLIQLRHLLEEDLRPFTK